MEPEVPFGWETKMSTPWGRLVRFGISPLFHAPFDPSSHWELHFQRQDVVSFPGHTSKGEGVEIRRTTVSIMKCAVNRASRDGEGALSFTTNVSCILGMLATTRST